MRCVELCLGLPLRSLTPSLWPVCRRAKAAWEEYFAEQLPLMKESKPGLKQMQYKNRIFENWQKDPRNPRNAPRP